MTVLYSCMERDPVIWLGVITLIIAVLLGSMITYAFVTDKEYLFVITVLCCLASIITSVASFTGRISVEKERFYVAIDNDAAISEIIESYNIIDQKDLLFILEEKGDK